MCFAVFNYVPLLAERNPKFTQSYKHGAPPEHFAANQVHRLLSKAQYLL
jgi:hypothetical protein